MSLSFFLTFRHSAEARLGANDQRRFVEILRTTPGMRSALVYTPESASDPYLNDGAPPQLAAELHFDRIEDLETAAAADGHLQALAARGAFPSLSGATVTQQAMLRRVFAVPGPASAPAQATCSYLVSYEGAAEDLNAWLHHYIAHHPPIMARFPGIRGIEVCTRIDWRGFLPWQRVDYMLRNKVVFDSAAALTAALNSPVRDAMRADYRLFPPFTGPVSHYPMATLSVPI